MLRLKPAARYPADPRAVFVLGLAVISGFPLLISGNLEAGSLEEQLPHWGVMLWGAALLFGSLLTLAAMTRQTVNGIILEQIGSVTVGAATLFYSGIIIYTLGRSGSPAIPFILGFGLSCFWRWGQLQALLGIEYEKKMLAEAITRARGPE